MPAEEETDLPLDAVVSLTPFESISAAAAVSITAASLFDVFASTSLPERSRRRKVRTLRGSGWLLLVVDAKPANFKKRKGKGGEVFFVDTGKRVICGTTRVRTKKKENYLSSGSFIYKRMELSHVLNRPKQSH